MGQRARAGQRAITLDALGGFAQGERDVAQERELLFGVMAVQLGVTDAGTVMSAGADWATRRASGKSLGDLLVERQAMTRAQLAFLNDVVERALALHGSEAAALSRMPKTLTSALTSLSESTGGLGSVAIADTISSGERRLPFDSLSGLDNVSVEAPGRYEPRTTEEGREEELGRGGIGRVLAVTDHFVGRDVALKMLLREHLSAATVDTHAASSVEARFLREARVTGQLEHPAIVPVYEIGRRKDGSLYYTMRRIEGRTLAEAIAEARTLDARLRLMPHVLTLCQAVAYAHDRGVIHRDLKPQNVMLGRFGETYLLDWGLARVRGRLDANSGELKLAPDITGAQEIGAVGTPSYMSPEQAWGRTHDIDERSDVWGLGAVLYEVLTGQPPYVGSSAFDVLGKVREDPWRPVRELAPTAPGDLIAICEKALQRERIDRYPRAVELAEDLEMWRQGRNVGARVYKAHELVWRFARRNKLPVGIAAAALLALTTLGAASALRIRAERNEARAFAQLVLKEVTERLTPQASAQPLIESLTARALAFYDKSGDFRRLPANDRLTIAQAMAKLAGLNRAVGLTDKATQTVQLCLQVVPEPEAVTRRDSLALALIDCLVVAGDVHDLKGDDVSARREWEKAEQLLRRVRLDTDDPAWLRSAALVLGRLGRAEASGELEKAYARLKEALGYDERVLALEGDAVPQRVQVLTTRRDVALMLWRLGKREDALLMNERALVLGRTIPRLEEYARGVSVVGSTLRQQGLFLTWSGRGDEAKQVFSEAARELEWAVTKQPDRVSVVGELADTWLELGRPDKAAELLGPLVKKGLSGDYRASYLLAAALAGQFDVVIAAQAQLKAGADTQELLALAVVQALSGEPHAAAQTLRLARARLELSGIQWPKGALAGVLAAHPGPAADVLKQFSATFERAYGVDDDDALAEAISAAAAALEALP